jgi:hypothetical protein
VRSEINKQSQSEEQSMNTNSNSLPKVITLLLAAIALAFPVHSTRAEDQVPFQGSADGAIVGLVPDPGGVVLTVLAEGNAAYLGEFAREETILFNPATGVLTGLIVFTGANGDELFGTVDGGFVSDTEATGTYTFTGGTGRFQNASGEADFFLSTSDGVHFTVEFDGSLSSVGANKK